MEGLPSVHHTLFSFPNGYWVRASMSISRKLKPSVAFVKAVYNVWYYNINGIKDEVVKLLDDSKVISLFCVGEIHDYYLFCKNDHVSDYFTCCNEAVVSLRVSVVNCFTCIYQNPFTV